MDQFVWRVLPLLTILVSFFVFFYFQNSDTAQLYPIIKVGFFMLFRSRLWLYNRQKPFSTTLIQSCRKTSSFFASMWSLWLVPNFCYHNLNCLGLRIEEDVRVICCWLFVLQLPRNQCSLLPHHHFWISSKRIVTPQGIISGSGFTYLTLDYYIFVILFISLCEVIKCFVLSRVVGFCVWLCLVQDFLCMGNDKESAIVEHTQ